MARHGALAPQYFAGDEDPTPLLDEGVVQDAQFFLGSVLQGWLAARVQGHAFDGPQVQSHVALASASIRAGAPPHRGARDTAAPNLGHTRSHAHPTIPHARGAGGRDRDRDHPPRGRPHAGPAGLLPWPPPRGVRPARGRAGAGPARHSLPPPPHRHLSRPRVRPNPRTAHPTAPSPPRPRPPPVQGCGEPRPLLRAGHPVLVHPSAGLPPRAGPHCPCPGARGAHRARGVCRNARPRHGAERADGGCGAAVGPRPQRVPPTHPPTPPALCDQSPPLPTRCSTAATPGAPSAS